MIVEIHNAELTHKIEAVNSKLIVLICPDCGWVYVMGYNALGRVSQAICPGDLSVKHTLQGMGEVTITAVTEDDQRQAINDLLADIDLGELP